MTQPGITIIGAGPAGMSAAMQLTRQGQSLLVLEGKRPGGLLHNANWVENYPGFPAGISGPSLVNIFQAQIARIGVEITSAVVHSLKFREEAFILQTDRGSRKSDIVVIATGTKPIPLTDVAIPEAVRSKVVYEVADIWDVQNKNVLIVGAGDAALDYALHLAPHNQVVILNRGQQVKGLNLLWKRVQEQAQIRYHQERRITRIASGSGDNIQVVTRGIGGEKSYLCDYVIPAIGRRPALDFIDADLEREVQYLVDQERLFFIGDVKNGPYRQTAIAVGDGIKAAMIIGRNIGEGMQ